MTPTWKSRSGLSRRSYSCTRCCSPQRTSPRPAFRVWRIVCGISIPTSDPATCSDDHRAERQVDREARRLVSDHPAHSASATSSVMITINTMPRNPTCDVRSCGRGVHRHRGAHGGAGGGGWERSRPDYDLARPWPCRCRGLSPSGVRRSGCQHSVVLLAGLGRVLINAGAGGNVRSCGFSGGR